MWKLIKVQAKNFISFKSLEFDVEQGVATLIFGENHDSEKQKNNGSGKSSIIETISFGLLGEPLRKVKAEEIINDNADMAEVKVMLHNDFNMTDFTIYRTIFRDKTAQRIDCVQTDANGHIINEENTVQPSVADYNRFILDELGLTKDEVYNNYILCRSKYVSFFESSDREKKEIINRFSNGDKVDESIEALAGDITIAEGELYQIQMEESKVNGRIEAVDSQIEQAEIKKSQFEESKMAKISGIKEKIEYKNGEISELRGKIRMAKERLQKIKDLDDEMVLLEDSKKTVIDCYKEVSQKFTEMRLSPVSDYSQRSAEYEKRIADIKESIKDKKEYINSALAEIPVVREKCADMERKLKEREAECEKSADKEKKEIDKLRKEWDEAVRLVEEIEGEVGENRRKQAEIHAKIAVLETLLNGVVTCPSCGYQFAVSNDMSKEQIEGKISDYKNDICEKEADKGHLCERIEEYRKECEKYNKDINAISKAAEERSDNLWAMNRELASVRAELNDMMFGVDTRRGDLQIANGSLESCEVAVNGMRRSMFDEVFDHIDAAVNKGKAYIKQCEEEIEAAKSSIGVYEESITEIKNSRSGDIIESLEKSREGYVEELTDIKKKVSEKQAAFDELKRQEGLFVEFKTHLANTKIDAISKITNQVLKDIGSDIRINLQGFKVLKTGKVREKITVQVLRNGIDCGSFEKMSAGERARICLANIIALQALINSNASEYGRGLDFMAIDEIMDVSDEIGLMSYCEVINRLGITVLMITQGMVSESYQHKILVVKNCGYSHIVR